MRWRKWVLITVLAMVVGETGAWAAEKLVFGIGVRSGFSAIKKDETFHIHELIAYHTLPWDWQWNGGWILDTFWEIHFGLLRAADKESVLISTGPMVTLQTPWKSLAFMAAVRPAFLEDHNFGKENLGGEIQFTEEIGINLILSKYFSLGYRFQHLSNAGLYTHNPGLDFHVLELRCLLPGYLDEGQGP
ncbi:acyloxyacyl hydrolase [Desulfosoma caldarium]|uniref:Lipid A 3-O-deacylase PagL n=1 Tax=Desulfosoma caldarium TaxID=610254 RepID=A0A3N1UR37_9BACT|nr:acyloxyacyl hydrolase [Desulfosoma caldarium]ROQ91160.1 lipid A 3-O-deacylase PagL [Desulfosoma caldarium]